MTITIKMKKGIDQWYYRFELDKRQYRGFIGPVSEIKKSKASAIEREIKAKIITKQVDAPSAEKRISPQVIIEDYLDYLKLYKPNTYKSAQYSAKSFRYFYPLTEITREDVRNYKLKRLEKGVSPSTVNREIQYLRAAYNRFEDVKNPFSKSDFFREYERTRSLSKQELKLLLLKAKESQNKHLPIIIQTGIQTGMRKQEILNLHISQIHKSANSIVISAQNEKSGKNKTISCPPELIRSLLELGMGNQSGYVFENSETGKPYTDVKKAFHAACKKAGIENFRFHDLRHTFATYALLFTKDIRAVQDILGHSRITTTQKYAHVLTESKEQVANAVGGFLGGILKQVEEE